MRRERSSPRAPSTRQSPIPRPGARTRFGGAHARFQSRPRIATCPSCPTRREGVAERNARLVFRRSRRTMEVPHLPEPIPDPVIALIDLGGTNAKWCGWKPRDSLSPIRFDAHDILTSQPGQVAANLQAQANWLGDLRNCDVALQRFPQPGLFFQAVVRVAIQVVLEIAFPREYRA